MRFVKMQGTGNDFVVVDGFAHPLDEIAVAALSRAVCDRHFGIGADGLVYVLPAAAADFTMRMFNPDGSEAEMCGNGIRCAAKFAYERGLSTANPARVATLAGVKTVELVFDAGRVSAVKVDMGEPLLDPSEIPMDLGGSGPVVGATLDLGDSSYTVTCVSMGNPHCVTFVRDVESFPVREVGPRIEHHPLFPKRTNAEFVQVLSGTELRMRVWERGAGETLACGTGACATAVAAALTGLADRAVTVHLNGGDLEIEWTEAGTVMMTGPAVEVFTGEYPTP